MSREDVGPIDVLLVALMLLSVVATVPFAAGLLATVAGGGP